MTVKNQRIKKSEDFEKIFKTGKTITGRFIFLKTKKNENEYCRFCFVAGLKFSKKAVERNKTKRRLKAIINEVVADIMPGYDMVVIAKNEALKGKYREIKEDFIGLLKKSKIFKKK